MVGIEYVRPAIDFVTLGVYTSFVVFVLIKRGQRTQKIDNFMVSTIALMGLSAIVTFYIDLAHLYDLPMDIGGL